MTAHYLFVTICVVHFLLACFANAQLSPNFYARSCPRLQLIVRDAMRQAVNGEARIGASILQLFFHDCFVNVRHVHINQCHFLFFFLFFFFEEIYIYIYIYRSTFIYLISLGVLCFRAAMHRFYWMTQAPSQAKKMFFQIKIQPGVFK
jgi:hypothetical protein